MSLTYSQTLLLNTIRSSIYQKHRLNDLASFLWLLFIMLSRKTLSYKERGKQGRGGGRVGTHSNSNDQTK